MKPERSYLLYTACHAAMFSLTSATYVPFLLELGLTLSQVTLVNVFFWLTIVLFEVPTGMLADARSRKWSLRVGFCLFAVGFVGYFFAQSVLAVILCEIIDAIAFTFLSGIESAWIVDALHKHGRQATKGQVFANATIVRGAVSLPGAFLGSLIGSVLGLDVVWLLAGAFAVLGIVIVSRCMNGDGEATERVSEVEALRLSLKATRSSPALRWSLVMNLTFALVVAFNHLWAPYFGQWVDTATLGLVWVPIYLSFAIAGTLIRKAKIDSGAEGRAMLIALIIAGVGLIGAGQFPSLGLTLIPVIVYEVGRAAFGPLLSSYTQHHVASNHRATYGSLQSLAGEIGSAIVLLIMSIAMHGQATSSALISSVWAVAGVALIVLSLIAYQFRPAERAH